MPTDTFEFTATDTPVLESDTYQAALEQMELRQSKTTFVRDDGTDAPDEYYSYKFRLLGEGHEDEFVFTNSSTSFGRKSKMRKWFSAILNREIQTGDRLTLDDLRGVPCRLVVKKERDNEGVWGNKVTDILPAAPAPRASVAPPPSSNGTGPKPTLEELFEDATPDSNQGAAAEAAGLIRRYEVAKKKLGWTREAYDTWAKRVMGWTAQQIQDRPGLAPFEKMAPRLQRAFVEALEKAALTPDAYDQDGDLAFSTDPDTDPGAPAGDEGDKEN